MDLDFTYKSVKSEEFERRKELLILDLAEWIAPKMNAIHQTNHSSNFWVAVLGQHLSTCINKKHLFDEPGKIPRYFSTLNVLGKPPKKQVLKHQLHFIAKTILDFKVGRLKSVNSKLSSANEFSMGPRANELIENGKGAMLEEYTPLLLLPKFRVRRRWKQFVNKEKTPFLKAVLSHLPLVYVEYFHKYYNSVVVQPELKVFHAEHLMKIHSKVLIAKYFERGAKFFYYQGGAGYGEILFTPRKHIYATITAFRTYGWQINAKDEPYPAYRLESFKKDYDIKKTELDTTTISKGGYHFLVVAHIVGITDKEVIKFTNLLFEKLDKKVLANLKLRFRPKSGLGKANAGYDVLSLNKGIELDSGIGRFSIIEATIQSDLNIHLPVPSTHLYECVVVGQPFVCLNRFKTPSDIMKPYINFFYEKGIFHDDIESMAKHLNNVNIESWWNDIENHEMFKSYHKTFCGGAFNANNQLQ